MHGTCLASDDSDCPWYSTCRHNHNLEECLAANADRDTGPKDADSEKEESDDA